MPSDRPPSDPALNEETARLTPAVLEDDDALDEVIGSWGAAADGVQKFQAEIDLLTGAAQELCCDEQWDVVDKMVAAIEAQQHELRVLVARRAFEEGRNSPNGADHPDLDDGKPDAIFGDAPRPEP